MIHADIHAYNERLGDGWCAIGSKLARHLSRNLPNAESRIWHAHPVWFIDGNPVAGYAKLKDCIRLLFWSGQSFGEEGLVPEGSFKAAEARFIDAREVDPESMARWCAKARSIQWDYKNIVKRKGKLVRLRIAPR